MEQPPHTTPTDTAGGAPEDCGMSETEQLSLTPANLLSTIRQLQLNIGELRSRISHQDNINAEQSGRIARQDNIIAQLEIQNRQLRNENTALQERIRQLENQNLHLIDNVNDINNKINVLTSMKHTYETDMDKMMSAMVAKQTRGSRKTAILFLLLAGIVFLSLQLLGPDLQSTKFTGWLTLSGACVTFLLAKVYNYSEDISSAHVSQDEITALLAQEKKKFDGSLEKLHIRQQTGSTNTAAAQPTISVVQQRNITVEVD